jgi:PAS domain S-box-containing protein
MGNLRTEHSGKLSLAYLLAGLVATAIYFALPTVAAQNVAYDAIGVSAVVAVLTGVWYHRPDRRLPWYLLALGDALSVAGDMLWTYDENVRGVATPFPSFADVLYLGGYAAFFAGVLLLIRAQGAGDDQAAAIDTAIITVGGGVLLWTFLISPQWDDATRPVLARLVAGAYPAVDLLILAAAARLALGLARQTLALRLLLLSMASTLVADIVFAVLTARGEYQTSHPVDSAWLLAYLLHGTLALHPSMRARLAATAPHDADPLRGRLPLLALAALTGPALLAIQSVRGAHVHVPLIAGASAILVLLALARLRLLAEALRRREAHFRALVQHAADGVAIARADGVTLYHSPAVAAISGFSPDELIGRDIFARVHADDLAETRRLFAALVAEPGGTRTAQVRARHADGRWRDLEVHGTNLLREPAVRGIVLNYRDVTERVRHEQAQQFLARASEQLGASLDFDTTLTTVAALVVPAFADWCIIDLRHQDGALVRAAVHHADPALATSARALAGQPLAPERQVSASTVVRTQHDHAVGTGTPDLAAELAACPDRIASYRALGIASYIATPLRTGSRTLGTLTAVSADPARCHDARELALLEELARRAALALDNTGLHRALAARELELQDLVGRLILQQEEERRRVAYDIHDGITQLAASIHQHLQAFAYQHRPRAADAQRDLDRILVIAQQAVQEARRVIAALRPTALDDFGLGTALRHQVEHLAAQGWQITYCDRLAGERLPPTLETALYRVAQEALNNVGKHAGTTAATVVLERAGDAISLCVRDDGAGFAPQCAADGDEPGQRIGLRGMRERVTLLGGSFSVSSRVGGGTEVRASVPAPPPPR